MTQNLGTPGSVVPLPYERRYGRDPHDMVTMELALEAPRWYDEMVAQQRHAEELTLAAKAAIDEGREDVAYLLLMQRVGMPVDSTKPEPLGG